MSKGAYENYFRQSAPEGAVFGVDMSWFQATADGENLDHGTCYGYWLDVHTWAYFVNIRSSYGANGDDGAQGLHWQVANELGYTGKRGMYHFVHAERGVLANFNNFMNRTEPYADQLSHYMGDYEASPNAGAGFINEFCDRVEQKRQKPMFNYGGKYYIDAAGELTCPAKKLWIAHYPPRSVDAWNVTSPNGAPNMPDQYAYQHPGCWQWQSSTPEHGHLDLNISTTPEMFGGSVTPGEDGFLMALSPEDQITLRDQVSWLHAVFADDNGRWGKLWNAAAQTERVAAIVERFNTDAYVRSTGTDPNNPDNSINIFDALWKLARTPNVTVDVAELAKKLAPLLPDNVDEAMLAKAVVKALGTELTN